MTTHPAPPADVALDWSRSSLRRLVRLMVAANVLVPLSVFIYAAMIGEDYWWYFWGEGNLVTWFSSVQLLVVAGMAWANHRLTRTLVLADQRQAAGNGWIWLVFAAGFVFLSFDEVFEVHETLRDEVLIPNDMFSNIPMVRPGDVGMFLYLFVGIVLAAFLYKELHRRRTALLAFAAAVMLIASTSFVDSLPREIEESIPYFWTSAFEEIGENCAQLLFLVSFWLVLDGRLAERIKPSPPAAGAAP